MNGVSPAPADVDGAVAVVAVVSVAGGMYALYLFAFWLIVLLR